MISYIDCNIFNYILSVLSIFDLNDYTPSNCVYHKSYIYAHINNMYITTIYIPKLFIKQYLRPFHDLDEKTWNQILLELI